MAGEFNAGSVVARLKLVDDGFRAKLKQAFEGASTLQKGMMAAGAAAVTMGVAVAALTKQAADYTDKLGKLAQQIGMTTEQISSFALAASLSDLSTEEFGKSVSQLNRKMVDAASGNVEAAKSFQQLGVSVKNSNGTLKTSEQMLEEIADKFAGAKDSATKTALAMDLMGRAGASMIPLLNGGAKEIKNVREEAQRMGLVFSQDAFKAAEEFNDAQTRIGQSLVGLRQQIAGTIISLVNQSGVFEMISKAIQSVTGWWMGLSENTREAIIVSAAITSGLIAVAGAASALSVVIPLVSKAMVAAFITNPVGLAIAAIAVSIGLVVYKWKELVQWMQPVIKAFQDVWQSVKSLKDVFQPLIDSFSVFKNLFKGDTFKNVDFIATGLKAGLIPAAQAANVLAAAMGAVVDTIDGVVRGFKGLFKLFEEIMTVLTIFKASVESGLSLEKSFERAFMTQTDMGITGMQMITNAWEKMGDVATDTTNRIGQRFAQMAERNTALVRGMWTTATNPPPGTTPPPPVDRRGEIQAPQGEMKPGGGKYIGANKGAGPSMIPEGALGQIQQWGDRVFGLMSKISADSAQIAQNNLTKISNFASLWVDVYKNNLEKAHEAEREQLQAQEDEKLNILRAALDTRLMLINEEFAARKAALESELVLQKQGIDAMTAQRIADAEQRSVDTEERMAAVRTIEEDGERQKEEADKEHQARIDAERQKFQGKATAESKKATDEFEAEKKASAKRMMDLEKRQADEKKDISKKAAAFEYTISLASFRISQQQAAAQAKIQYAQALMSALTTGMQMGPIGAMIAIPALMGMATMAFASSMAAIASTPPPMPPAELFMQKGGMVPGPLHSQGGVKAELEGGEYVMPRGPAMANLGALEAMRDGRMNGAGGITVIVHVGSMDPAGRSIDSVGRELGLSVRSHL